MQYQLEPGGGGAENKVSFKDINHMSQPVKPPKVEVRPVAPYPCSHTL